MSDKRKIGLNKPPVPARPKNLVVLNSKHLPKPPEIFSYVLKKKIGLGHFCFKNNFKSNFNFFLFI